MTLEVTLDNLDKVSLKFPQDITVSKQFNMKD